MTLLAQLDQPMPGISPDVYCLADFAKIAGIVHKASGIVLVEGKAMLVYSRLAPLVRESGCGTFSRYLDKVAEQPAELDKVVTALTTNHTFFYREAHHFEHFERVARPGLMRKLGQGKPVRLWSAGCSSGEETWSLVMALLGSDRREGQTLASRDLRVLASDISPPVLKRATAAIYPEADMKPVPSDLVGHWTKPVDGKLEMVPTARSLVRFRHLNLQGKWPMSGTFDVIFCRNVMIYFDLATKEQLVSRFARILEPGGYLYIGHSERVTGSATALLQPAGPTIYRRRAA